jgi:hypothetical protein
MKVTVKLEAKDIEDYKEHFSNVAKNSVGLIHILSDIRTYLSEEMDRYHNLAYKGKWDTDKIYSKKAYEIYIALEGVMDQIYGGHVEDINLMLEEQESYENRNRRRINQW